MKTIYVLKLPNKKNINRLLSYNVFFTKIEYHHDNCLLYVDANNYEKIIKYCRLYDIKLERIEGRLKYQKLLLHYAIFIISIFFGIIFLYLLTYITFDIKIMTDKQELIKIIQNELDAANLVKYQFIKSYKEKEDIKRTILENYKDKFEWIEIDRIGTKYYISILERVINKEKLSNNYQNIVARKNAVIKEIRASSGEIIRKINDYVNKGDIIISGKIMKKDEIKNIVEAKGQVYGETWYNVTVKLPTKYVEKKNTGRSFHKISLNFFDKKWFLFKSQKYQTEEYIDKAILKSSFLPISLNNTLIKEVREETFFYTYQDALDIGLDLAQKKLLDSLKGNSKILYQKKLKLYEENSTIIIEVFFKVYEDITDYQTIIKEEGE